MRWTRLSLGLAVVATAIAAGVDASYAGAQAATWHSSVDSALGRAGAIQPGDVYKFSFPRSDLHVQLGAVQLKPALALGSWIAFMPAGRGESIVMGDLVLTEEEIGPVMRALQMGGLHQTALHNHLRGESPHIMYMHVMGHGKPVSLARAIRAALALTATPIAASPAPAATSPLDLDTVSIAQTVGHTGKVNGGVYQITVPRAEIVRADGLVIPPAMGVATAINFQPTAGGEAVATGDFVLLGTEVNPIIRDLQSHGIEVTALHSHMLNESPRLLFMHFWASGPASAIARGLRSALDRTKSRK